MSSIAYLATYYQLVKWILQSWQSYCVLQQPLIKATTVPIFSLLGRPVSREATPNAQNFKQWDKYILSQKLGKHKELPSHRRQQDVILSQSVKSLERINANTLNYDSVVLFMTIQNTLEICKGIWYLAFRASYWKSEVKNTPNHLKSFNPGRISWIQVFQNCCIIVVSPNEIMLRISDQTLW